MGWFSPDNKKHRAPKEEGSTMYRYGKEQREAGEFVQGVKNVRLSVHRYEMLNWLSKYQSIHPKIHVPNQKMAVFTILSHFKSLGYNLETRKIHEEEYGTMQDRADRLILLALKNIKESKDGSVQSTFTADYIKHLENSLAFRENEGVKDLVAQLDEIPAENVNNLLDWLLAYFKTKGEVAEYEEAKEHILRSFEQKGYRPFVEGDPTASVTSTRTTIEQTLRAMQDDRGIVPQFFEVKHRQHRIYGKAS